MTIIRMGLSAVVLLGLLAGSAFAQGMMGGSRRDPSAALANIFGKDKAFSATAHVTVKDQGGNQMQTMEVVYAVLDGKVRAETDLAKMQTDRMPPEAVEQMKSMGLDKNVTLFLSEPRTGYMIYPGLKAYCELPTRGASETNSKPAKVERSEIGKETIDGHPCVKYKVTATTEGAPPVNALVWEAADLDNYPIQTQMEGEGGITITTLFQNIKRAKPAASLFDLPTDYKRYGSVQELMMSAMGGMSGMPGGMPGRRSTPPMPRGGRE